MKDDRHYSGDKSEQFWSRVNALKGKNAKVLYSLGCELQNLEEFVLKLLQRAEDGETVIDPGKK